MRAAPQSGFQLPQPDRWVIQLLVGLLVAYVIELVARNSGLRLDGLALSNLGGGFQPWQPITRFLVQGRDPTSVVFGLLVLYFFLPIFPTRESRRTLLKALAAAAVGGTVLALSADAVGLVPSSVSLGWSELLVALVLLFGLKYPSRTVNLFFVFPVKASWFIWLALGFDVLNLVMTRSMGSWTSLGAWAGVMAWWYGMGPGARRRKLKANARSIEKELRRFQVIEGGKQDSDNRDDTVH